MNFIESIRDGFVRCFDFSGRSSRKQFWFFYLFHELATTLGFVVDNIFGWSLYKIALAEIDLEIVYLSFGPTFIFTFFLILIPFFAVKVRRFHDVGKSGIWVVAQYFLMLLSFFTSNTAPLLTMLTIYLIIFWCFKGEEVKNSYGDTVS